MKKLKRKDISEMIKTDIINKGKGVVLSNDMEVKEQ